MIRNKSGPEDSWVLHIHLDPGCTPMSYATGSSVNELAVENLQLSTS